MSTASPELAASGDPSARHAASSRSKLARFAWGVTAYTWLVVLFGAAVRFTGSGAGCGQHWPTCHGEVVHLPRSIETAIELTHRATSGLSFLAALALAIAVHRRLPRPHRARTAVLIAMSCMLAEVLVGARLVLARLVGSDASPERAVVMPIHLVLTSLLLGSLALTAFYADSEQPARREKSLPGLLRWLFAASALGVLVVSATGALTALGDTLFPVQGGSLGARLAEARDGSRNILEQLRILHPVAALVISLLVLWTSRRAAAASSAPLVQRFSKALSTLVFVQLAAGVINVVLSAPGWMQLVHLALATLLWLSLVLLAAASGDAVGNAPASARA